VNLYGFVGNNGVGKVDILGRYPGLDGHGSITSPASSVEWLRRIVSEADAILEQQIPDRSYTFGEQNAREASRTMARLKEFLKQNGTDANNHFVYTCKYGWLDMGHFLTTQCSQSVGGVALRNGDQGKWRGGKKESEVTAHGPQKI